MSIARSVVKDKSRITILALMVLPTRMMVCSTHRVGMVNTIFFAHGWLTNGWWAESTPGCTKEETTKQAANWIGTNVKMWDMSAPSLTCSDTMNTSDVWNEYYKRMKTPVGSFTKVKEGYVP